VRFIFVILLFCGVAEFSSKVVFADDAAAPVSAPAISAPPDSAPPMDAPAAAPAPVTDTAASVPTAVTKTAPAKNGKAKPQDEDTGEYEVDYEEEPDSDAEVEATPAPKAITQKKGKAPRLGGGPAVQGSRAQNRFISLLKSETKSVYKKNGKPLDVDSD